MDNEIEKTEESTPPEPLPVDASMPSKIKNEIILSQKLENLNVQASSLGRSFVNTFLRQKSAEFKQWKEIGAEIAAAPLTSEGKLRLAIKHELMEDRVIPQRSILLLTLLPFAAYWGVKKGLTYFVSSRIENYQRTQARIKRRAEQAKTRETKRLSKGLPAKR